jgi:dTDP-4-dehydrorhamnose 3,5-epimerase-like enzyme
VKEGQTLFIPSGWWHFVVNLTDTIAINHWWSSQRSPSTDYPVGVVTHRPDQKNENVNSHATSILHKLQKEIEQLNQEFKSSMKSIKTSVACERY